MVSAEMAYSFMDEFNTRVSAALAPRLESWGIPGLAADISMERPAVREHGDLSLNLAMAAAGPAGRAPRELAAEMLDDLEADTAVAGMCKSMQIAGPGFINIVLADKALVEAVAGSLEQGASFGSGTVKEPQHILLEFVSANPTGPLHVGHARYAAYGDSLKRMLSFAGHRVESEFYINDYGSQMEIFGRSLAARYEQVIGREVDFPQDGYQGDYIVGMAESIAGEIDEDMAAAAAKPTEAAITYFRDMGCRMMLDEIKSTLARFRVGFDNWFSEAGLYERSALDDAVSKLRSSGDITEKDSALWLETTRYGDDKDRVLIRSGGEPTYFASDIAYHQDKLSRGYDHLINIWGADHHGYVPRVKAAVAALSHDPGKLEIIIGQLVNILEMGERQQMSKRAGKMVALSELLDEIGVDASRFFLVDRSHDSTLDLDLQKARLKSDENPVYYVQYAHARICSILKKADAETVDEPHDYESLVLEEQERDLILKILEFPGLVLGAGEMRSPNRLTAYARELAASFHVFYHNCPVLRAPQQISSFRLDLCNLTRNVIRICLDLVGVRAPESM